MTTASQPAVLAIDWGNSGMTAWLMDRSQRVLDALDHPVALKDVSNAGYADLVATACAPLLDVRQDLPVILCGMVGARGMWVEAPYASSPARLPDLVRRAVRVTISGHPAAILPGADFKGPQGFEVMRGEEVQILGAARMTGRQEGLVCIPGAHSKWARLESGALAEFETWITGELFQLLRQGIVGRLAEGDVFSLDAYRRGLERGRTGPVNRAAFSARSDVLAGALPATDVSSYISGLLIGSEVSGATPSGSVGSILLLAKGVLAHRYRAAFEHFGLDHQLVDAREAKRIGLALAAAELWPVAVAEATE
jgi:2-dehydro-3-deoxygalactonokinase